MPVQLSEMAAKSRGNRKDALSAASAALAAADPGLLVRRSLKRTGNRLTARTASLDLDDYRRVVVVGGGKASGLMAVEVDKIIGDRLDEGIVIVPEYQERLPRLRRVRFEKSTHPLPSAKGEKAVSRMLSIIDGAGPGDLVVVLLSGGGSALMPAPHPGVSVRDLILTTRLLLNSGADIGEINCVRKHLSRVAGGRLAERANGAEVLSLLISDVVGDDLSTIASGPTVPDPTTFADARRIMESKGVWKTTPQSVRRVVTDGIAGEIQETPKPGSRVFENVRNVVVGSNTDARLAARASLEALGYRVETRSMVTGEAKVVGKELADLAMSQEATPWAAVWGGETTVSVEGKGIGGRNQEGALAAAIELDGSDRSALVFFGTDGVDGPTDAAGAIADGTTFKRARRLGLDARKFLANNDSHTLFKALGDLIVTGPSGTNVNDVMIAVVA